MDNNEQSGPQAEMEKTITSAVATDIHSEFFKKSHALVFSRLTLSPVEHDIFALLLSRLHKDQWQDFIAGKTPFSPSYEFKSDLLCDWFDVKADNLYNILYKPAERLSERKIGVTQEGKDFDFIPLFKRIQYKQGTLTIKPNDELITEYLGISQGHAQIPHDTFRKIKTEHGKRLYSMLCRFKSPGLELHAQSIEDLHGFFGLLNNKGELLKKTYAVNANFINRIIKPAIAEIDEHDQNIIFLYDGKAKKPNKGFSYIKSGRKITGIKFLFEWTQHQQVSEKPQGDAEMTLEAAINTYSDLENNARLPSEAELKNLKNFMGQLIIEKFNFNDAFIARFKEAENAYSGQG